MKYGYSRSADEEFDKYDITQDIVNEIYNKYQRQLGIDDMYLDYDATNIWTEDGSAKFYGSSRPVNLYCIYDNEGEFIGGVIDMDEDERARLSRDYDDFIDTCSREIGSILKRRKNRSNDYYV